MWNHAQGFGEWSAPSSSILERVIAFYKSHGTRGAICMTPRASTEEAMAMLDKHGFEPGYAYRKFQRDDAPPPMANSDLAVRAARAEDAQAFGEIVATAFGTPESFAPWVAALVGRPRWHCFLAWDGDRLAGTGALFVHEGIGYCTFGATHPEARRKGAQRALLAHRIAEGLKLGCRRFVTETGEAGDGEPEQSYRNILWVGFERAYLRDNWVPKAVD
jgi:GNAT superfamily N-acetyltransferase